MGRSELHNIAVGGVIIQLGVLVYAFCTVRYPGLKQIPGFSRVTDWSLYLTTIGTGTVVAGMLLCAYIIENSTVEERYTINHETDDVHILWVQKDATVSDQVFNSYVIFAKDKRHLITTSRRNDLQPQSDEHEAGSGSRRVEYATVAAVLLSFGGFMLQFIGLRGMHWTVSVAQLGATLLMTALRAFVRRGLAEQPHTHKLPEGHEIDWLATRMSTVQHLSNLWGKPDSTQETRWWRRYLTRGAVKGPNEEGTSSVNDATEALTKFWSQDCLEWGIETGMESRGYIPVATIGGEERADTESIINESVPQTCEVNPPQGDINQTPYVQSKSGIQQDTGTPQRESSQTVVPSPEGRAQDQVQKVLKVRQRLGFLTRWPSPYASQAAFVALAIEIVMNTPKLFSSKDEFEFIWTMNAPGNQLIRFSVTRKDIDRRWEANLAEIEAALSLWLFSVRAQDITPQIENDPLNNEVYSDNGVWLRSGVASRKQGKRLLGKSTKLSRRDMQWWMGGGIGKVLEVNDVPETEADAKDGSDRIELIDRVVGSAGQGLDPLKPGIYRVRAVSENTGGNSFDIEEVSSLSNRHITAVVSNYRIRSMSNARIARRKDMGVNHRLSLEICIWLHTSQIYFLQQYRMLL